MKRHLPSSLSKEITVHGFEMEAPRTSFEGLLQDKRCRERLLKFAKSTVDEAKATFQGQIFSDLWREATSDITRALAKDLHQHWRDSGIVTDRMGHNRSLEEILDESELYLKAKCTEISGEIVGRLHLRSWAWDASLQQEMKSYTRSYMLNHPEVSQFNLSDDEIEVFLDDSIQAVNRLWQRTLDHYSEAVPVPKDPRLRGKELPGQYVLPEDREHLKMLSFGYLKKVVLGAAKLAARPRHITEVVDEEGEAANIYDTVSDAPAIGDGYHLGDKPMGCREQQQLELRVNMDALTRILGSDDNCGKILRKFMETAMEQGFDSTKDHCDRNGISHSVLEKCLTRAKKIVASFSSMSSSKGEQP